MKDIIVIAEKGGENKELLTLENADKTAIIEVAKVSSAINLKSKHSLVISNAYKDAAGDLELMGIKKYYKCASQI